MSISRLFRDTENCTDWEEMEEEVYRLIKRLQRKPNKAGYRLNPGSILNAYREGDLTFAKSVKALKQWHRWKNEQEKKSLARRNYVRDKKGRFHKCRSQNTMLHPFGHCRKCGRSWDEAHE